MATRIGIITAGGDSPGLNAAIRGVGKAALACGMEVIGFRDGFRGLAEDSRLRLDRRALAGILTTGGTVLGTGRDKPHRMEINGQMRDMCGVIARNCKRNKLDALVCIGGGGTHKNALRLIEKGLNVITLPKTIDNDIALTEATIGFDTALGIATEAIDRLHSTAHSHHRIIIAEVMGHRAGWLALGAGIAGGADVILLPEIPYDVKNVELGHVDGRCSFESIMVKYELNDPALDRLATIVRGADTGQLDLAPEAAGLLAASLGLSRMYADDLAQLEAGISLYDAFYRWCRDATDETHGWPPHKAGA